MSPDGTKLYVTDYDARRCTSSRSSRPTPCRRSVHRRSTRPTRRRGRSRERWGWPTRRRPLTYTVTSAPTKGTLVLNANGTFTYTPTASARHAASAVNACDRSPPTRSPSRSPTAEAAWSPRRSPIDISPTNKVPTVTKSVGAPEHARQESSTATSRAPTATMMSITYTASTPAKGTVVAHADGSVHVHADRASAPCRHEAGAIGRRQSRTPSRSRSMTATAASSGRGDRGSAPPTRNPPGPPSPVRTRISTSGKITGTLTATDADGDTLTYTATLQEGHASRQPDGTFTYTPTAAARRPPRRRAAATDQDRAITITVADGHGGTGDLHPECLHRSRSRSSTSLRRTARRR